MNGTGTWGLLLPAGLARRLSHGDHVGNWVADEFLGWNTWAADTTGRAHSGRVMENLVTSPAVLLCRAALHQAGRDFQSKVPRTAVSASLRTC